MIAKNGKSIFTLRGCRFPNRKCIFTLHKNGCEKRKSIFTLRECQFPNRKCIFTLRKNGCEKRKCIFTLRKDRFPNRKCIFTIIRTIFTGTMTFSETREPHLRPRNAPLRSCKRVFFVLHTNSRVTFTNKGVGH